MELDEEGYVESFKPHIMDVMHAWCSVSGSLASGRQTISQRCVCVCVYVCDRVHHLLKYAR